MAWKSRIGPRLRTTTAILVIASMTLAGSTSTAVAQDLQGVWGGGVSITLGVGPRSGDWGLNLPVAYRPKPWSTKGPYFGIGFISHKGQDSGDRGQTDRTVLIPLGIAFFSDNGITTSPHITFGYASDDYDTWGLGGYLCGELRQSGISSSLGCESDWAFAYGAGLDLSYRFVVVNATWIKGAGWYLQAGYRLWGD